MKSNTFTLTIIVVFGLTILASEAAVTNYSGDEVGFNSAIAGLTTCLINFDDLTLGDIIYDQYNPPVRFVTNEGYDITANDTGSGTPVHSGPLCAQLAHDPEGLAFGELQFSQPVWGASLWVLDVRPEGLNISIFDCEDELLTPIFHVESGGLYTYVGVLSDVKEICGVRVETIYEHDGIGFDDVTVVPEPSIICLLSLGGIALLRKRRH